MLVGYLTGFKVRQLIRRPRTREEEEEDDHRTIAIVIS